MPRCALGMVPSNDIPPDKGLPKVSKSCHLAASVKPVMFHPVGVGKHDQSGVFTEMTEVETGVPTR